MVNLYGVQIAENQLVHKALRSFFGIGHNVADRICAKFSIHKTARISQLTQPKVTAISSEMTKMVIDTELKRKIGDNIMRLKDIGTYRGKRHAQGLPVRGQKTKKQIVSARRFNRVSTHT
ncbi:putative ribosomal protein S13 [Tuber borchii]|uniref:Putative ribosomal protein S13 n=1 Tax=Tuber borchii TaxID=42251 RepID=A0A2T7A3S4_TUBBO|nr:putative ribosomal protein S13 [Tuber borchii]